jgi:EAL domain-containing protein (putative c-di-GMP-specific phosphodiesterase class I)
MRSSTATKAVPRVSVRTGPALGPGRYRTPAAAGRSPLSTPAGGHGHPWVRRLRRALDADLFELHFQPIASLRDGSVRHYEALLRLVETPGAAPIAPGRFLPAAERYGLIREIDRAVLAKLARLLAREPGLRDCTVAMNVSALTVTDGRMLAAIGRELARNRVAPWRLAIEITETVAISDMDSARAFCAGVLELGCGLALDDFGAGFGSFQYLKQLPFSHLKIDGDFIRSLPSSRTDQLVVRALARIVKGMGRETIAEFVGDRPTIDMLRAYEVDYAQGFALGRPEPLHALVPQPG